MKILFSALIFLYLSISLADLSCMYTRQAASVMEINATIEKTKELYSKDFGILEIKALGNDDYQVALENYNQTVSQKFHIVWKSVVGSKCPAPEAIPVTPQR